VLIYLFAGKKPNSSYLASHWPGLRPISTPVSR